MLYLRFVIHEERLNDEIVRHILQRGVDGVFQRFRFPVGSNRIAEPGILFQGLAGIEQFPVMPVVDVDHRHPDFDVGFGTFPERVGKLQNGPVFRFVRSVIEADAFGRRRFLQSLAVQEKPGLPDILFVDHRRVDEITHRHIRVDRRLLLVKAERVVDQERNVVFHSQIENVADGVQLNIVRIGMPGPVHRVIELKGPFLMFGIPENEFEKPVAELALRVRLSGLRDLFS